MAGPKRSRSGRKFANARPSKSSTRSKEQTEMARIANTVNTIPSYSSRFQIFRQNRRQKAKQTAEQSGDIGGKPDADHPIFRASRFMDLPLSGRTLDGLAAANFTELTGIQKTAIPQALAGRDVLAAAPTGSGKTLAFLVPMLEVLWRDKWNTFDGLGALIISPTRELSMQIFEVLRSVARKHTISAGLVIGGKDFESERERVGQMNVLVATPGRLLHHMDHVAELDCSNLRVLIFDEADRILEMGFAKTIDAILSNIPNDRQTLLFSATQTKNVRALSRLSLKSPEYVAVHTRAAETEKEDPKAQDTTEVAPGEKMNSEIEAVRIVGTPSGLSQSYAIVPAHDKLSVLWSFIKTHLKAKMIVFFSTGKQVRFVFETFCKLRPGMSLLHIHGNMKQMKRTDMYDLFCRTKSAALFATDVASRGLDFPDVEWVIQVDCPESVGIYVHRVGRTARFNAKGRSMLLLNEGKEEKFVDRLKSKKLELRQNKINPKRITSIEPRIAATIASNQELKKLSQRAFMFYVKSIYQQSDKEVFDVTALDFDKLARSFGLTVIPRVSFKQGIAEEQSSRLSREKAKNVFGYRPRTERPTSDTQAKKSASGSELDHQPIVAEGDDEIDELLKIRRIHNVDHGGQVDEDRDNLGLKAQIEPRKRKKRKLDLLGALPSANRIVFTEDGNAIRAAELSDGSSDESESIQAKGIDEYAAIVSKRLADTEKVDKDRERERVRSLHARRRARERERNKVVRPDTLVGAVEGESDNDSDSESSSQEQSERSLGEESNDEDVPYSGSLKDEEQLALQVIQSRRT